MPSPNMPALAAAALALVLGAPAAQAGVIYENPTLGEAGSCGFNTACAAMFDLGDAYAAQRFTLDAAAVVKSASFTVYDPGSVGTGANWGFYLDDGVGGLPGTLVASGNSPILQNQVLATGLIEGLNRTQSFFDVPAIALGPGGYYFAIQSVTDEFRNFLSLGAAPSGAAQSADGGATWRGNYSGLPSVAVGLYDTSIGGDPPATGVPEAATWALMILGFGVAGAALRRRRTALSLP